MIGRTGFQTSEVIDGQANDVMRKISEFATTGTSSNLLVLAVMCHGDERDNMKFLEKSMTVAELIDALTVSRLSHTGERG